MKQPLFWVLLGVLLPASQALAATTGPLEVEDLSSPVITASSPPSQQSSQLPSHSSSTAATPSAKQGDGDGLYMMMERMQRYQRQIDQLRGQVEELKHTIKQMQNGARDRYMDLDTRLRALADDVKQSSGVKADAGSASDNAAAAINPQAETAASSQAAPASSDAAKEADRKAYTSARGKLLSGDHEGAISALSAYLKQHPNGQYVPQAHYWLGEVYRIEGDKSSLEKAAHEFKSVVNDYPQSTKLQEALYKLAVVRVQQGDDAAATRDLKQLLKQFPNGSAASLAKKLLKQL